MAQYNLFNMTMQRKWKEVAELYVQNDRFHDAVLTKTKETALHIAILHYTSGQSSDTEDFVKQMIESMSEENLWIKNFKGNTPLHLAAAIGWTKICGFIANKCPELIASRNLMSETPLFTAALHGRKEAFECLHQIYVVNENVFVGETGYSLCRRNDGNTVLHFAISGECFGLALKLMEDYPKLVNYKNVEGQSALFILSQKPKLFRSVTHPGFWDSIISTCTLGLFSWDAPHMITPPNWIPDNYTTFVNIFSFFWYPFNIITRVSLSGLWRKKKEKKKKNGTDEENQKGANPENLPREDDSQHVEVLENKNNNKKRRDAAVRRWPPNNDTLILLLKFGLNIVLTILGVGIGKRKKIELYKKQYLEALEVIDKILGFESSSDYVSDGTQPIQSSLTKLQPRRIPPPTAPPDVDDHPKSEEKSPPVKNETPFLAAARMGIHDMVERILYKSPIAVYDQDPEGMNVLMIAAKHRQTTLIGRLLKMKLVPENVFQQLDIHGNNIFHHAAMLDNNYKPWCVPGAAFQMQWEINWYEYVKTSIPSIISKNHMNTQGDNPRTMFTKTHENLVKEGSKWLIKTSVSCSVVAALIAGAAFGTTASIPGGPDQYTGYPLFKGRLAFNIFSIAALLALCLSVTSLVFFLAIITSRGVMNDFKSNLPKKLLNGLTCLFAAIVAMLASFCAGHTFILAHNLKVVAIPIYSIACLPITFFVFAQLPLYADLFRGVWFKVPLRTY